MDNLIIIAFVAAVLVVALISTVNHFKGKSGCCGGGGSYKPRKKKLRKIIGTKTFRVEGMHCEHCSNRVTEAVNDIPHVAAKVDLKKGLLTVSYEEETEDELIRARIERAGYTLHEL